MKSDNLYTDQKGFLVGERSDRQDGIKIHVPTTS